MELYHRTLLQPNTHSLALAVHLDAIKPKQEYDKPRQLLLCLTNALQLYRAIPNKVSTTKYELKLFHHEQLFSSVCAAEIIVYQDEELRQDIVIVTLGNGKYQLLQWRVQKFALTDQKLVFGEEQSVDSGLCKPKIGHYVAVNNDAKLVLIAAVDWECKLYTRTFSMHGMILTQIAHLRAPYEIDRPSICQHVSPSYGPSCSFYSLRSELKEGQKQVKVYKVRRGQEEYEEEGVVLEDSSVNMVVGRSGDNFFVVGEKYIYYTVKGKLTQLKVPQSRPSLQVSCWKRPLREKKEEYFLLNDLGELIILNFDDTNASLCSINYVEGLVPSLQGVALQKNLFFLLTANHQNLLLEAVGKYKCEDRIEKTRASKQSKEQRQEQGGSGRGLFKEFDVVGSMEEGRIIRDLKICNIEKGMSNQILVTGGRPGSKRGFLSVMKHGLKMKIHISINLASTQGIWPIRRHTSDKHHSYIVISFANKKTTTYIHDCGRLTPTNELRLDQTENTLHVVRFGDNSLLQVSPSKLKYINKEGVSRVLQIKGRISKATSVSEGKQLLLMLLGGYIEYYEVSGGELVSMKQFALQSEVNNVEFGPTELVDGKPYARMLAIGLSNYHVNVYAVGLPAVLTLVASRNIKNGIESLAFVSQNQQEICVNIGTNNGRGFKWLLQKNGEPIQHPHEQVHGEKGIKFAKLSVGGKASVFRLTPEPYLSYYWQGQLQECSIPLPALQQIAQVSLQGIEGSMFITYYGGYLRFVQIYGFGNLLYTNDKQLQFPGRRLLILQDRLGILTEGKVRVEEKEVWVSKFFILNPAKEYAMEKNVAFQTNEKVLSMSALSTKDGKNLLCFGCCIGHTNFPPNSVSLTSRFPSIKVYSFEKQNEELLVNLLFSYPLDNPPTAMESYFSQLLVGVGRKLMLYDIYKQKLVVRAISDMLSSPICTIHVDEEKIFVTQVYESFSLMKFNPKNKCFDLIGQDFIDRFTTCACLMDGEAGVMAGGDKFGNFYVSKMSEKMKVQFEEIKESAFEPNTNTFVMQSLAGYHIGEVITAVQNGKIDPKKPDCIFYATIDGRIGMFYPLEGEEEAELNQLKKLESELSRSSFSGATNHKNFRNYFNPSKGVVDGDFCHLFEGLSEPERLRLNNSMQKETKEINSLLTYMQNKFS